jgi:hypothetical protein
MEAVIMSEQREPVKVWIDNDAAVWTHDGTEPFIHSERGSNKSYQLSDPATHTPVENGELERLREALREIANTAHHGGLFETGRSIGNALKNIRRLSLPFWDKEECNKLQAGRRP